MTYDELIAWAIQTLPNARAVEMADGEIAILTGYREREESIRDVFDMLSRARDKGERTQQGPSLVPIDLGSDNPSEVSLDPGSGVLSGAS